VMQSVQLEGWASDVAGRGGGGDSVECPLWFYIPIVQKSQSLGFPRHGEVGVGDAWALAVPQGNALRGLWEKHVASPG
jgi:hypothetical protein